jgi:hypothetical protein
VPALQVLIGMNLLFSFASYGLSMYDWYLMAGLTEVLVRLSGASMATAQAPANIPPSLEFQTWRPLPTRS